MEKQEIEKEMQDINEQFNEFLHTKGIGAKFRLAFANMSESAQAQHEIDKANFEAIKAKSTEENKEFVEFLHTKGLKAKLQLVIENIKKGSKEAPAKTKANIAAAKANVNVNPYANPYTSVGAPKAYTAHSLADEFNAFLKMKGLDTKYSVVITEEK